jgi:hypothetical protein
MTGSASGRSILGQNYYIPAEALEAELGAAPVPALGIVADGVVGAHADPVRDGAVLLHLLAQLLLDEERLLGRHGDGLAARELGRRRKRTLCNGARAGPNSTERASRAGRPGISPEPVTPTTPGGCLVPS